MVGGINLFQVVAVGEERIKLHQDGRGRYFFYHLLIFKIYWSFGVRGERESEREYPTNSVLPYKVLTELQASFFL